MTPELKHAIEAIRDECRKPKAAENCTWAYTARCNLICEVCSYNSQSAAKRLLSYRTPAEYSIELWEKENTNG